MAEPRARLAANVRPRIKMGSHQAWAKALRLADSFMHGHDFRGAQEPRLAIQGVTRSVVLCDAPTETFSQKMPTWVPQSPSDRDLLPIDVLYGTYNPQARLIEIYAKRIECDARLYGGSFEDLLQIVRLHEYAHAVLHLGVPMSDTISTLGTFSPSGTTDWNEFVARRTRMFSELDSASHEFLAQAITYACLCNLPEHQSSHLKGVFEKLEAKQPQHYVVPTEIKATAANVDWSLALRAARQEIDVFRGDNFLLYDGLLALAREFSDSTTAAESEGREWVAEFSDPNALNQLKAGLLDAGPKDDTEDENLELLVDRFGGLKVEVFAREHPPPHFRVRCAGDSANYEIADCTQLNGGLRREYRAIREWHAANKAKLIAAWNAHRPSDCPVGEYREA